MSSLQVAGQTTIAVRPLRGDVDAESFADLTDAAVVSVAWIDGGRLAVTFDAILDDDTADRVLDRLVTADEATEALRADVRAKLATDDPDLPKAVARLLLGIAG